MRTLPTFGRRLGGAVAGLLAAGVALGVAELAGAFAGASSSPVIAVGGAVVDAAPPWLKEFAIATFGTADKPVLLGGILVVLALLAVVAGMLAVRRPLLGMAVVVLVGVIGAVAAVARPNASAAASAPSLLGALAGVLALRVLLGKLGVPVRASGQSTRQSTASDPYASVGAPGGRPPALSVDRRGFLWAGLGVAAVAAGSGVGGRVALAGRYDASASRQAVRLPRPVSRAAPVRPGTDLRVPGLGPFFTPNDDLYRVDTALFVPQVSARSWRLRVHGMVDRPIELDYEALLRRGLVERDITLCCVSNEVGGEYAGNARWLGAPLADLLRETGVRHGADQILSRSSDGMTISTPTSVVMDGRDALLAVGMNGLPLPAEHGFPVRMVVPGLYGFVSATKWVVDLELTRYADAQAYWTERGWSTDAPVLTMSRIDVPATTQDLAAGPIPAAGVAWAQHRGIERVEVRVDRGPWHQARLARVPGDDVWRQWVWQWDASPGSHTLEVRATDKTGAAQTSQPAEPFPSGATGWHSRVVQVS